MKLLITIGLLFLSSFLFSQSGKVIKVKDGDTIVILDSLNTHHTIRLADIDCPERGQPFFTKSKNFVSDEVYGKPVIVIRKDTDRYGRAIGLVLYENKNLSLELLKSGLAWHYSYFSDDEEMAQLEVAARSHKVGLWADKKPINPYHWRKERNALRRKKYLARKAQRQ